MKFDIETYNKALLNSRFIVHSVEGNKVNIKYRINPDQSFDCIGLHFSRFEKVELLCCPWCCSSNLTIVDEPDGILVECEDCKVLVSIPSKYHNNVELFWNNRCPSTHKTRM